MNTINVALVSPFSSGPTRGNMTTVRRIADNLAKTGCRVTQLSLDTLQPKELQLLMSQIRPDLLHAFHAHHGGPTARSLARELGIPYLVTITGSDLFDPDLLSDLSTGRAIVDASAVTCFDPLIAQHLAGVFPEVAGMIAVIPQGVTPLPVNEPFPRKDEEFIVLLPAAIRPVKGITSAIEALTPLAAEFPFMRLLLAGGNLDPLYAAGIKKMIAALPFVHMLGEVPHQLIGNLLAASDLVLNCSLFEGGMANTLLEAMVMCRPVLARNVLGNRSLISHGKTGWLYNNDEELRESVRMILLNPGLGIEMGEAGRNFVQECCSTAKEAERYREVYVQVLAGCGKLA